MMMFNVLNAATWGDMAKEKEKNFYTRTNIHVRASIGLISVLCAN